MRLLLERSREEEKYTRIHTVCLSLFQIDEEIAILFSMDLYWVHSSTVTRMRVLLFLAWVGPCDGAGVGPEEGLLEGPFDGDLGWLGLGAAHFIIRNEKAIRYFQH